MVELVVPERNADEKGQACDALATKFARKIGSSVLAEYKIDPKSVSGKATPTSCQLQAKFNSDDKLESVHVNAQLDSKAGKAAITLTDIDRDKTTAQTAVVWDIDKTTGKIDLAHPSSLTAKAGDKGKDVDISDEQKERLGNAADVFGGIIPDMKMSMKPEEKAGAKITVTAPAARQ